MTQLEQAARHVLAAWRTGTIYELYHAILGLQRALNGSGRTVVEVDRPPDEMYEGAACSLAGG